MNVNADDRCANCGCDFADHDYIPNSIDQYQCPHPNTDVGYGYFHGGDPRNFHPDVECCTQAEVDNHRRACELWNEAERDGKTPEPEECPSGWIYDNNGKPVVHVLRSPYGIGTYTYEVAQFWEPAEFDEPEADDE